MKRLKKTTCRVMIFFISFFFLSYPIYNQQAEASDKIPEHEVQEWRSPGVTMKKDIPKEDESFFSKYKWWILGGLVIVAGGAAAAASGGGSGGDDGGGDTSNGSSTDGNEGVTISWE